MSHHKVPQLLTFTTTRTSAFNKSVLVFMDIILHSVRLTLVWASQIKTICLEHLDSAPVLFLLMPVVTAKDTGTASQFMFPLGSKVLNTKPSDVLLCNYIKSLRYVKYMLISEATLMICY